MSTHLGLYFILYLLKNCIHYKKCTDTKKIVLKKSLPPTKNVVLFLKNWTHTKKCIPNKKVDILEILYPKLNNNLNHALECTPILKYIVPHC